MNFGEAIKAIKDGKKVTRKGWNGKGMFLEMVNPNLEPVANENGTQYQVTPFICIKTPADVLQVWNASQADVFAEDWILDD